MEYRPLGTSEFRVSRLCFGCFTAGGHGWGKVEDRDSIDAIRKARDLGVTFFDTADIYGMGHSEVILQKALERDLSSLVVSTKGGIRWNEKQNCSYVDCSPAWLQYAVEQSLRRLKIEAIPLYHVHRPDPKVHPNDLVQTLNTLKQSGKIIHFALSNYKPDDLNSFLKFATPQALQCEFNLLNKSAVNDYFELCKSKQISLLAYSPLAQGLLTGKFNAETKFAPDDCRSRSPAFKPERLKENIAFVNKVASFAAKHGQTATAVAISWILAHDEITSVIVGARNKVQITENVNAASWKIPASTLDQLAADLSWEGSG